MPLVALDAEVHIRGATGERAVPLTHFYVPPIERADIENALDHGEMIIHVDIPLPPADMASAQAAE